MIDLGEWANDGYRIEGEPGSADRMSPEELDAAADPVSYTHLTLPTT